MSRLRASARSGFALLIVVTLLAFIVLLLVGLAAYTRIETSVAGNTQRQAQAREHALTGLQVALAQLQRHAGPDQRATANAASFGGVNGTRFYTGVWGPDGTGPLTWLVSGNEFATAPTGSEQPPALAVTPASAPPPARAIDLVARGTTNTTNRAQFVSVPLQDLRARGLPGSPNADATYGRYAWWVGDEGVKAPVAVPDTSGTLTAAPYDSADLRGRVRQHLAVGAGAAGTNGSPVFEPRDANNAPLVAGDRVLTASQLGFLRNSGNGQLGHPLQRANYHVWSPNNLAVLADSRRGGLRQDLSLAPGLLGSAFVAWTNYPAYTESTVPVDPETVDPALAAIAPPAILPAYGSDPVRRRLRITPPLLGEGGAHQIAPVLSYFLLSFNVRTAGDTAAARPFELAARWLVSLWNPYTSALVPENLRLEITGLPRTIRVVNVQGESPVPVGSFSVQDESVFGSPPIDPDLAERPLIINLPWTPDGASADRQSWLPGRVYTWRSVTDNSQPERPPETGFASQFYSRTLDTTGAAAAVRPLPLGEQLGSDNHVLEVDGADRVTVTVYLVPRTGPDEPPAPPIKLATYISPEFVTSFASSPQAARQTSTQFSYVFRLAESIDTPAAPGRWLTTSGLDPRRRRLPGEAFVTGENGNDPSLYVNYRTISAPDRLLDRGEGASDRSYNEDVPVFELPRAPLLSLGATQHFRLPGQRPFMVGNSWGFGQELNGVPVGELFDRYFFSGVRDGFTPGVAANGDLIVPNPLLRTVRWYEPGVGYRKPTTDDLRATVEGLDPAGAVGAADARSSRFFLQAGAFNLNSTNVAAWAAVLRGVRFPAPQTFRYLSLSSSTGVPSGDTSVATVQSTNAQFLRFSQTAQETYQADAGRADPAGSAARTELFRRGMRTLSATETGVLAAKIVELITARHGEEGPFLSVGDFLAPHPRYAAFDAEGGEIPRSLLEAAIAETGINTAVAEIDPEAKVQLNSQWLTQGDVMTALAPALFARSDTFTIRAYGEAVNPATNATEGRAWCEALVQRVPEYFDPPTGNGDLTGDAAEVLPENLTSPLNLANGRRFRILSFRWLTQPDL
ncbi:MAG: hypothetical protein RLZZ447_561 [Verrucomicrobiota bacterium]